MPAHKPSRSLTAAKGAVPSGDSHRRNLKRKRDGSKTDGDTPRAFARIMAFKQGVKPFSGLDDGKVVSKRRERPGVDEIQGRSIIPDDLDQSIPRIMPGERLADFSARVDGALPVRGLVKKGRGKDLPGIKRQQTKLERKIQRMQEEWRKNDARRKEKLKEAEEDMEDQAEKHGLSTRTLSLSKRKRKGNTSYESDDEDPWASIAKARQGQDTKGLVGLHDVVEAPPVFTRIPKERLKAKNVARANVLDIPGAAGSLRRREELSYVRKSTVEAYREMMERKLQSSSH